MSKLVLCGVMRSGTGAGYSDLVCNTSTGEVIYCDDLNGNCVVSNVSVRNPMELPDDVYLSMLDQIPADGIIATEEYMITLRGDQAEFRSVMDAEKVVHTVTFDTDVVYEGSVELME